MKSTTKPAPLGVDPLPKVTFQNKSYSTYTIEKPIFNLKQTKRCEILVTSALTFFFFLAYLTFLATLFLGIENASQGELIIASDDMYNASYNQQLIPFLQQHLPQKLDSLEDIPYSYSLVDSQGREQLTYHTEIPIDSSELTWDSINPTHAPCNMYVSLPHEDQSLYTKYFAEGEPLPSPWHSYQWNLGKNQKVFHIFSWDSPSLSYRGSDLYITTSTPTKIFDSQFNEIACYQESGQYHVSELDYSSQTIHNDQLMVGEYHPQTSTMVILGQNITNERTQEILLSQLDWYQAHQVSFTSSVGITPSDITVASLTDSKNSLTDSVNSPVFYFNGQQWLESTSENPIPHKQLFCYQTSLYDSPIYIESLVQPQPQIVPHGLSFEVRTEENETIWVWNSTQQTWISHGNQWLLPLNPSDGNSLTRNILQRDDYLATLKGDFSGSLDLSSLSEEANQLMESIKLQAYQIQSPVDTVHCIIYSDHPPKMLGYSIPKQAILLKAPVWVQDLSSSQLQFTSEIPIDHYNFWRDISSTVFQTPQTIQFQNPRIIDLPDQNIDISAIHLGGEQSIQQIDTVLPQDQINYSEGCTIKLDCTTNQWQNNQRLLHIQSNQEESIDFVVYQPNMTQTSLQAILPSGIKIPFQTINFNTLPSNISLEITLRKHYILIQVLDKTTGEVLQIDERPMIESVDIRPFMTQLISDQWNPTRLSLGSTIPHRMIDTSIGNIQIKGTSIQPGPQRIISVPITATQIQCIATQPSQVEEIIPNICQGEINLSHIYPLSSTQGSIELQISQLNSANNSQRVLTLHNISLYYTSPGQWHLQTPQGNTIFTLNQPDQESPQTIRITIFPNHLQITINNQECIIGGTFSQEEPHLFLGDSCSENSFQIDSIKVQYETSSNRYHFIPTQSDLNIYPLKNDIYPIGDNIPENDSLLQWQIGDQFIPITNFSSNTSYPSLSLIPVSKLNQSISELQREASTKQYLFKNIPVDSLHPNTVILSQSTFDLSTHQITPTVIHPTKTQLLDSNSSQVTLYQEDNAPIIKEDQTLLDNTRTKKITLTLQQIEELPSSLEEKIAITYKIQFRSSIIEYLCYTTIIIMILEILFEGSYNILKFIIGTYLRKNHGKKIKVSTGKYILSRNDFAVLQLIYFLIDSPFLQKDSSRNDTKNPRLEYNTSIISLGILKVIALGFLFIFTYLASDYLGFQPLSTYFNHFYPIFSFLIPSTILLQIGVLVSVIYLLIKFSNKKYKNYLNPLYTISHTLTDHYTRRSMTITEEEPKEKPEEYQIDITGEFATSLPDSRQKKIRTCA